MRHRQTKGVATDMVDLRPPRHIPTPPLLSPDVRPSERPLWDRDRAPKSRSYTLPNTIVHGLFVLMTRPVGVSIPFAWLILNGTIVSVCCSSLKPSSALAA